LIPHESAPKKPEHPEEATDKNVIEEPAAKVSSNEEMNNELDYVRDENDSKHDISNVKEFKV
jgi:hypothetical protein